MTAYLRPKAVWLDISLSAEEMPLRCPAHNADKIRHTDSSLSANNSVVLIACSFFLLATGISG